MRAGTPEGEMFLAVFENTKKFQEEVRLANKREAEKKQLEEVFDKIKTAKRWGMIE